MLRATAVCNFSTSELPKVFRTPHVFYIFATAACNFCASELPKVLPPMRRFVHFHFQMCVSPQRRVFFRHPNFKKCSENVSFLTFSLPNLRFATAACIFSTSELQKVFRERHFFKHFHFQICVSPQPRAFFRHPNFKKCSENVSFFNIFTSKFAFRHSGVHFFDI